MNSRRLSAFVDALVAGRRSGNLRADPEDADVLRMAIALRASRPGDAEPDEQFVSDLYEELLDQADSRLSPSARPVKIRRGRTALAAVAASIALVGGTVAATQAITQRPVAPSALQVPHGQILRTATFETAGHQVSGQIVAYRSHPSWVFMNVDVPHYAGTIFCRLRASNGTTVDVGKFELHNGTGEFSRSIQVDVGRLRGAELVTSSGSIIASASFA
ncbi:MAG: hypothetical protein JWO62_1869 [Acidimicrobiaceae bacterium]|nr:hypothetical protein [Acidimicrobiaceae bacterium]